MVRALYGTRTWKTAATVEIQLATAPTTIPDLDGNLWILPTGSMASQNGQLVYDVINARGVLFERVRLPAGRSVAGFGKGGVVYLASVTTDGLFLERTRLVVGAR